MKNTAFTQVNRSRNWK